MTDPRSFLYRSLDPDEAQRLAARHLAGHDDGELYLQYRVSEAFGFDDGRLKHADYNSASGFGLRGVTGETTAFAHANEISAAAIERAAATLKLLDAAKGPASSPPGRTNQAMYGIEDPLASFAFADKVALCQTIDAAARARDPRVEQASVMLQASWSVIEILRADGFVARDVRPLVRLGVSIVAREGDRRETGFHGFGGRYDYAHLFDEAQWNRAIDIALGQALVNLEAVDAPAGEMTVVCGPGWPGVLLHEAVGHGLEGDFNRKGTSAFSGRIGERVAAPGVTVVDDGAMHQRRGSLTIDDEGTPTGRTVLIEDGILKGYLQDRLNARLMGMAPTGNGRRESFAHAPMPRMTNTFMLAGKDDPQELVGRVKDDVLTFWFGLTPEQWWKVDEGVDAQVRDRFIDLHALKRQLPPQSFLGEARTALAAIILFDQFPRNMFRGHADQFMTDPLALAIAKGAVDAGFDVQLPANERAFLYMPFQHSEALADQRRSVALFTALGDDYSLGFAKKHLDVIERFGRFPHRNKMLGRAPRPDEIAAGDVFPW